MIEITRTNNFLLCQILELHSWNEWNKKKGFVKLFHVEITLTQWWNTYTHVSYTTVCWKVDVFTMTTFPVRPIPCLGSTVIFFVRQTFSSSTSKLPNCFKLILAIILCFFFSLNFRGCLIFAGSKTEPLSALNLFFFRFSNVSICCSGYSLTFSQRSCSLQ